ncbi:zinc finger E-box-binding homeobox 1-like isoform X2 [Synchiropus splendidus]|uniref:zinc finger E-box-binding homeobox 1-like isoform X2 n=1 Tax=Synchiropus splendidus TaxID=270530 RepID=UPI00237D9CC8|nr:zinc finger E-box-binding homeobox 1-like isoform X2 [Synchiropus splendidus]
MSDGRVQINVFEAFLSVTDFNNGLEASSDSDDDDKLHIVEEDQESSKSPPDTEEGAAKDTAAAATARAAPVNGTWTKVKKESLSEGEDDEEDEEEDEEVEKDVKDSLVEEILQQADTAIIYPEAPEDEQSPAETGGADENGTPDSFSQLHVCPFCSRGYKRHASLKDHIKFRHETSDDNYSCSHCSYTFTYRSQLERHMSHHRGNKQQQHHVSPASTTITGTRKFKCTECSKAFKYKHHLKEHLRIHSGEKPYECSNCKKRFSHSGSYSSHISSKKCQSAAANNASRTSAKPLATMLAAPLSVAPTAILVRDKVDSKPLQEQLPVTQIKSEPVEYECKPGAPATSAAPNKPVNGGAPQTTVAALPQGVAMVLPTVGLMSPISININDLQNVLKVAMEGNVLKQALGSANGLVTPGKQGIVLQQPQQQILSLPAFVDHDGTTKIIINYSISPTAGTAPTTQPAPLVLKNSLPVPPAVTTAAAPTPSKTGTTPAPQAADLSRVKVEPESPVTSEKEATRQAANTVKTEPAEADEPGSCLLCNDCPDDLEALHLLQHRKAANGEAVDSAALDPSFATLLNEAGVTLEDQPVDDPLSLLKNHFASNANPGEGELLEISQSVSVPVDVVRKWFAKRREKSESQKETAASKETEASEEVVKEGEKPSESVSTSPSDSSLATNQVVIKTEPEEAEAADSQAEPLDLSLPREVATAPSVAPSVTPVAAKPPLKLACLTKGQLDGKTIFVTAPQAGKPVSIVSAAQLPTLVAIAGQGTVGCLSSSTKRTILIPQLSYTYATSTGGSAGAKTVVLNGHKVEKKPDTKSEQASPAPDEQSDQDSPCKKRRLENGIFPCDLCSKVFMKGSSLLRHKYEHTGKRPHECPVCLKAFKHKHHLIEHSRLHSGEKPYQCDKCGKRFSHSGSYSQHMNHRYSYCKREDTSPEPDSASGALQSELGDGSVDGGLLNSWTSILPPQTDSDGRETEEEEDEEEYVEGDEAVCMDDIRVVQVDDGECEIYEEDFDEGEETGEVVEVEMGEEEEEEEEGGRTDCEADLDKSIREPDDAK